MFFYLSKFVAFFLQPFTWIYLPVIISFFLNHQVWQRRLRIFSLIIFFIFSNPYLSMEAMKFWEGKNKKIEDYHVGAIVLGGYANWNTRHQQFQVNESADRLLHAINLYKQRKVRRIILSGGSGMILKQEEKESLFVYQYLLANDIFKKNIYVEMDSRNTHENAQNTAELIKREIPYYSDKFLLITSAYHMRRASACFRKAGIPIETLKVDFQIDDDDYTPGTFFIPSLSAIERWNTLIKEIAGYTVYWINGYL